MQEWVKFNLHLLSLDLCMGHIYDVKYFFISIQKFQDYPYHQM
jgi:hypothetical protein